MEFGHFNASVPLQGDIWPFTSTQSLLYYHFHLLSSGYCTIMLLEISGKKNNTKICYLFRYSFLKGQKKWPLFFMPLLWIAQLMCCFVSSKHVFGYHLLKTIVSVMYNEIHSEEYETLLVIIWHISFKRVPVSQIYSVPSDSVLVNTNDLLCNYDSLLSSSHNEFVLIFTKTLCAKYNNTVASVWALMENDSQ